MTQKIDTIIWDLDQTLYGYWGELARSFSKYAAQSACFLSKKYHGVYVDFEHALQETSISYYNHGRTTTTLAEKYKLDEVELYRHHHQSLWDEFADREWHNAKVEDDIQDSFKTISGQNIRSVILTHGSAQWAENVTTKLGIRDHFTDIAGIDGYGLRLKSQDTTLFADFMDKCGIKPIAEDDYSNVMMVEDSPANLVIPKRVFNMHTVLFQRNGTDFSQFNGAIIDKGVNKVAQLSRQLG